MIDDQDDSGRKPRREEQDRDSQGDGAKEKTRERERYAQPGTNRGAVADGLEGSIMDDEPETSRPKGSPTADRPDGNDRRIDDL